MAMFTFILAYGLVAFYIGHKWGDLIIDQFKTPSSYGRIFPGQRWRVEGVGDVVVHSVWPECVTYYKASTGADALIVVNREDFEACARDMNGRDSKGRFRGTPDSRVLKFEIKSGGLK